ncbi:MAG TPA: tyrosine-type recombinase/integrase [Syntrophales bacterium]|nr:tyrosine-type recombinase/integrase [Syntrophales bacterium]
MKFTKRSIESLPLPSSGQKLIWADDPKGFGIRLTVAKKTYVVQGRVRGSGKSRRISLGEHGTLTLDEARRMARKEISAMLSGADPVKIKKVEKAHAVTLKKLVEKYIEDRRDLKQSSIDDINKHLRGSFNGWADRPFAAITRDKVVARFRQLSERSPAQANQAFRVLRALLNYARAAYRDGETPILPENPVRVLSDAKLWNRVPSRSGRIPTDKIGAAWNILRDLRNAQDQTRIAETMADAVSFLMLTGARWSEGAALTWDRVNLDEAWWYLPDPKNRIPLTLPLPNEAIKILERRPRSGNYVFPARSGDGHITDTRSVLVAVSESAGVKVSPHDLRRTFRAVAGECGIEFWKTKLLMGHKLSGDVTITHYTETSDLRYLAKESNRIADWIVSQGAIAASKNVLQFPTHQEAESR